MLELKNIPITLSILHEQEYHHLYRIVYHNKRRAFSERQITKIKEARDPKGANIQRIRWEVVV